MLPHRPFYFLRHGETDWNREGRMMGRADIPLNATGRAQAERAREATAGLALKAIAVSTLSRARETAEIVNRELSLAVTPLDDLREVDVGPFQGIGDPTWTRRWRAGEPMSGVETFPLFCARIARGLGQALALDHPVLVVAHGGVFRAIETMLGLSGQTEVPNAVLTRFGPPSDSDKTWRIMLV
ncbi:MAG TPA: histidine phosphatase family protein [Candidatus Binatia bacterium]|nr:histidine phosphatase family protein [Candidatus Binatia bacterium]